MTAAIYERRLKALRKQLKATESVLISKPTDIFYLTGFPQLAPTEREAFLLVAPKKSWLFHHSFSPTGPKIKSLNQVPKADLNLIADQLATLPTKQLLIDEHNLSFSEYKQLKNRVKNLALASLNSSWLWSARAIKDKAEIALMRQAGKLALQVLNRVKKALRPGLTERQVAAQIASLLLAGGAQEPAFPIIVAFGPHGALPHHQPTDFKLKSEMPVLIDLGARYQGYLSDLTRSFWFGKKPTQQFQEIEKLVQTAYQKTLDILIQRKEVVTSKTIDQTARQYLSEQGYGEQFIHTTGHGLGLEIHEPPSLHWQNETKILEGMTITIEPGLYLKNSFGYRHENTVLVTKKGAEILTKI